MVTGLNFSLYNVFTDTLKMYVDGARFFLLGQM